MNNNGEEMTVSTPERFAKHIPWLCGHNFEHLIDHHWEVPELWQECGLDIGYILLYMYALDPGHSYIPLAKALIGHTMVSLILEAFKESMGDLPTSYGPDQTGRLKYFPLLSIAERRWGDVDAYVELVRPLMMDAMTKRFGLTEEQDFYMALGKASMMG